MGRAPQPGARRTERSHPCGSKARTEAEWVLRCKVWARREARGRGEEMPPDPGQHEERALGAGGSGRDLETCQLGQTPGQAPEEPSTRPRAEPRPRNLGVGERGGRDLAPRSSWTPQVWKATAHAERRGRGQLRAGAGGGAPAGRPPRTPRSSWRGGRAPPLFFLWLRSWPSAGAQPGRAGRFETEGLLYALPTGLLVKPTLGLKSARRQETETVAAGSFLRSFYSADPALEGAPPSAWPAKVLPVPRRGRGGRRRKAFPAVRCPARWAQAPGCEHTPAMLGAVRGAAGGRPVSASTSAGLVRPPQPGAPSPG